MSCHCQESETSPARTVDIVGAAAEAAGSRCSGAIVASHTQCVIVHTLITLKPCFHCLLIRSVFGRIFAARLMMPHSSKIYPRKKNKLRPVSVSGPSWTVAPINRMLTLTCNTPPSMGKADHQTHGRGARPAVEVGMHL